MTDNIETTQSDEDITGLRAIKPGQSFKFGQELDNPIFYTVSDDGETVTQHGGEMEAAGEDTTLPFDYVIDMYETVGIQLGYFTPEDKAVVVDITSNTAVSK